MRSIGAKTGTCTLRADRRVMAGTGQGAQTRRTTTMNLLKLLFNAITSDREPDALPRSDVYRWDCKMCGDRYVG